MKILTGHWAGMEVTVCGPDGNPLPEYDCTSSFNSPAMHNYVKYIEVVPFDRFSLHFARPSAPMALGYQIYADGRLLHNTVLRPHKLSYTVDGYNKVLNDDSGWCDLIFWPTNNESSSVSYTRTRDSELGTLHVKFEDGHATPLNKREVCPAETPTFQGMDRMGLHAFIG
ncbi:hypothetical protein CC85DRAFT_283352 [Cutaneotrichosporon oleaginosum]|uniref:Uncharacterized protein n=1 Tax=Cutaneotrichosporon oleaginosum TaxID=879819 RepID=A0A0J0XUG8_9TREE|nr:uncharacterized protein CC85DRAFT_283352 [Cutaneotrichosporon oleaginosum]KLT44715.1 hypothetical protein CC85DRAFT_283352 [Cutaneotrichosporon oleaginosum]TXT07700.1 hypothetical protein COLE_04624 [Cutaneotrichosporon oleaginosum]